jgi:hypothetical protein
VTLQLSSVLPAPVIVSLEIACGLFTVQVGADPPVIMVPGITPTPVMPWPTATVPAWVAETVSVVPDIVPVNTGNMEVNGPT